MNLHWWFSQKVSDEFKAKGIENWVTNIDGKLKEVTEWTGRDPKDGWKPTEDSVYVGYGALAIDNVQEIEKSLKQVAIAGNFSMDGLQGQRW